MSEAPEIRLKRLYMRSIRRGIKEMDLLLTAFADDRLAGMSPTDLDLFEALLEEPDQDLLAWIVGRAPTPERYTGLIGDIAQAIGGLPGPDPARAL